MSSDEFADFYSASFHRVLLAVRAFAGTPDVAQEATQEAFARAYSRWPRLKGDAMGPRMGDYHRLEPEQAPLPPTRPQTPGREESRARPARRATVWTCWRRCARCRSVNGRPSSSTTWTAGWPLWRTSWAYPRAPSKPISTEPAQL